MVCVLNSGFLQGWDLPPIIASIEAAAMPFGFPEEERSLSNEGIESTKSTKAMVFPVADPPIGEEAKADPVQETALVFFSFECSGLLFENPRATELRAYIPSTGNTFTSLIDPGLILSEAIIKITGITNEMIRKAAQEYKENTGNEMNFKAVWMDFEAWIRREIGTTVAVIFAGHNIWHFDMKLHKGECERFGMKFEFKKSIDTLALSKYLYHGCSPSGLEKLARGMGITDLSVHRSFSTVILSAKIWNIFVEGVPKEKLNEAILSSRPVLSTAQAIRENIKPEKRKRT